MATAISDDDLPFDQEPSQAPYLDRQALTSEALSLLLEGSLPRLVLLLVSLGFTSEARQLIALQATILGSLTTPRRRSPTRI